MTTASRVDAQGAAIPKAPTPSEARIQVNPGLHSRAAALSDPQFALHAMQLTAAQRQALTRITARYKPAITAYIATINAALRRGIPDDSLTPMQDSLHRLLIAVRTAADSVITPAERQQFAQAMRQVHAAALPAQGRAQGTALPKPVPATLVPIPATAKRRP